MSHVYYVTVVYFSNNILSSNPVHVSVALQPISHFKVHFNGCIHVFRDVKYNFFFTKNSPSSSKEMNQKNDIESSTTSEKKLEGDFAFIEEKMKLPVNYFFLYLYQILKFLLNSILSVSSTMFQKKSVLSILTHTK